MKTMHDYYAVMFDAFLDAFLFGTATSIDMAVLSVTMLYDGRC